MAPRDPAKTARNIAIKAMTAELRKMKDRVLSETKITSEASLNAKIGGKAAEFIDLLHEQILSPEQYITLYMKGFKNSLSPPGARFQNSHRENFEIFKKSRSAQEYFALFLKRAYLRHFDELSRKRPRTDECEIWIGQNRAEYGLFVTPRYVNGAWENDRSEIRHFPKLYWTIGHVLESGLVVPGDPDRTEFANVEAYLRFFKNSLVRASGSSHEKRIANRYVEFVRQSADAEAVPLLIPEYRYGGLAVAHRYRLDFCIINPFTMQKVGFELSPWSSHGYLSAIKGLTQARINEMAKDNFQNEMRKHRAYFQRHNIPVLIYPDDKLADIDQVFDEMRAFLSPANEVVQLDLHLIENFFK